MLGRLSRDGSLYSIGVLLLIVALADLAWLHGLTTLDWRLGDVMVRMLARSVPADPDVVIVDIDDRSLAEMADASRGVGRFPWPRSVYGELLVAMERQGAKAVVLDVELYEPDVYRPEHDAVLNEAVAKAPNAYFPIRLLDRVSASEGVLLADVAPKLGLLALVPPQPGARKPMQLPFVLDEAAWSRTGYINFVEDADGIGRRYALACSEGGFAIPSLPLRLARAFGWPMPEPGALVTDAPRHCERGSEVSFALAWPAGPASHRRIAFVDVYDDLQRSAPTRAPNEFRDRIVIVGASATHLRDLRATPISSLHPGVEILATAIDNLKNGRHLARAPATWSAGLLLGLFLPLLAALQQRRSIVVVFGVLVLTTLAVIGIAYALLAARGTLVLIGSPLAFAWLLFFLAAIRAWRAERRAREQREQVLGRFLDGRIVRQLIAEGVRLEDMRSESRTITVLFSDIRGFTTLSEKHTAEEVVALLNQYLTMQTETVFRHGGTLDKFIGDAIMAFWNAPTDDPQHAAHAVDCALDMAATLERFNQTVNATSQPLDIGIGLHSGPAVVGFIGSQRKLEYTAIGDTVNLASRIEGETKGRSRVLVSQATLQLAGDAYAFRDVGDVTVKGRTAPVRLFAVLEKKT